MHRHAVHREYEDCMWDGEVPLTVQTESIGCKGGLVPMQTTFSLQRSNNLLSKDITL